jgi:hypothetical protein
MATAKPSPSWRDVLLIHPAAELFPRMSADDLKALGEDIKKNGLASPIVLRSPGYPYDGNEQRPRLVLDGISRLDAMERVGLSVVNDKGQPSDAFGARFRQLFESKQVHSLSLSALRDGVGPARVEPDVDPYAYVISANINRRHLTAEQRRDLIAKLIKATPEKSDRQIAETVKASPTTVGTVRAEMESKGDVSKLDTRTDSRGRQQSAHRAPSAAKSGKIKFTPKTIQQIKEMVADGKSPEDIAATVGVTTGALQVACSRLSISLRKRDQGKGKPVLDQKAQTTTTRDDIGVDSSGEVARLRARVDELQAEKRRLEIENVRLRSEIEQLEAAHEPASAARCDICREKKPATRRQVFVCDFCAKIHELATPPADDGLDIQASLRRAATP